jgi:starch phosphorylase
MPAKTSKVKLSTTPGTPDLRTAMDVPGWTQSLIDHLEYLQGSLPETASISDWTQALSFAVRDRLMRRWIQTYREFRQSSQKAICYLSAEFLLGPHLGNSLLCLGSTEVAREALGQLGMDLDVLLAHEREPGLGNGGLGRLAACFMDSMASEGIPAIGYGIRYEFGIFQQVLRDGWQLESTDKWLQNGNPWEILRPQVAYPVGFGGRTQQGRDPDGRLRVRWVPDRTVKGIAYDTPIPGYSSGKVNRLRLWRAEAVESFDFASFNAGNYYGAVGQKVTSENLTKVLYPNDEKIEGRELRLEQQYFFVSCSLRDILRLLQQDGHGLDRLPDKFAVQMNDTHPSIAVAELMRLLLDEHRLDWEKAWDLTVRTLGYTNHTLLPEALEQWSLPLFAHTLPRHLEIIFEINHRFLDEVKARFPGDSDRLARMSLIDEREEKHVRMAHLACLGSHSTNGVAALHSELLKESVLRDFHDLFPNRFQNVTNGVTPRRWMAVANPALAKLITGAIGEDWIRDAEGGLPHLEKYAEDTGFRDEWRRVKRKNKERLAALIADRCKVRVDPDSLFDVQVKRIHEYKRAHLNLLHVIALYQSLKRDPRSGGPPRTVIFGGKAAPGYQMAKLIIKLITSVADVVNADSAVSDRLRVVFLPDFNVTTGQTVYPGAELSEQISTAGKEASGTGNMKFSMNGALTIGTMDGANIEIREAVGAEHFFLFGHTAQEVVDLKKKGYHPRELYASTPVLREAVDLVSSGAFSKGDSGLFRPLVDSLLDRDDYLLFADFPSYLSTQKEAGTAYLDVPRWTRASILNVARMGHFSSDRSIRDYASKIWGIPHASAVAPEVK